MDVPAPQAGVVKEIRVKTGDKVSEGSLILMLEAHDDGACCLLRLRRRRQRRARRQSTGGDEAGTPPPPSRNDYCTLHRAEGRHPRRSAGAGCRPGRLHRGVPRRRPRQEGGAGRALPDARRRVPERRLHPVEGAAARREGAHRSRSEVAHAGIEFGKPKIDLARLRAWKAGVVGKHTTGLAGLAKQRKVQVVHGKGAVRVAAHAARRDSGRREDRLFRSLHHRRRLLDCAHPGFPLRRPAHDRLHQRARAPRRAEAAARHRRRHHRAGDGDGIRRAGREGHASSS